MDAHTLELLEFDKVRGFVASRAACSLGKDTALRMEPTSDPGEVRTRQALTTEMADALSSGLHPPFGGLHDIRPLVRRAHTGASLRPRSWPKPSRRYARLTPCATGLTALPTSSPDSAG